jgi:hypothetical protein
MKTLTLLVALLAAFAPFDLYAEGTPTDLSQYQPSTFAKFEGTLSKEETPHKDRQAVYDARSLPLAIKAKFTGKIQKIGQTKKDFIKQDSSRTSINDLYDDEVLMQSESGQRWVPIQRQMKDAFVNDVKAGKAVTLYVRYIGSFQAAGKMERVYLMTEFQ